VLWERARDTWVGDCVRAGKKHGLELWIKARASSAGDVVRDCTNCMRELSAWCQIDGTTGPNVRDLTEAISALRLPAPGADHGAEDSEAPIFLLSNGMRAGSTLLQRILVTDRRVVLWGEPFGGMDLITKMVHSVAHPMNPWNLDSALTLDPNSPSLATSWIADFYPPSEDFRLALRNFFDRWLGAPARRAGFVRWGFKEIRLSATEAMFLRWLYPGAKFIVLSRHPYDCYRSLADSGWVSPVVDDAYIDSAAAFARLWNRLVLSWAELPQDFPAFHIKYEDLTAGNVDFRELEGWLGIEINESLALSAKVGSTAKRSRLSWYERLIISRVAASGMQALAYPA